MTYEELLNEFTENTHHLRALISARGVSLNEEVHPDFLDVLKQEGYDTIDLYPFPITIDHNCICDICGQPVTADDETFDTGAGCVRYPDGDEEHDLRHRACHDSLFN